MIAKVIYKTKTGEMKIEQLTIQYWQTILINTILNNGQYSIWNQYTTVRFKHLWSIRFFSPFFLNQAYYAPKDYFVDEKHKNSNTAKYYYNINELFKNCLIHF